MAQQAHVDVRQERDEQQDARQQEAEETRLKELLYRAETERLQLQQRAGALERAGDVAAAAAEQLRASIAEGAAALAASERRCAELAAARQDLEARLAVAVREYRANDILAVGLRERIASLAQRLRESQDVCAGQAARIASFQGDMDALASSNASLTTVVAGLEGAQLRLQQLLEAAERAREQGELELADTRDRHRREEEGMRAAVAAARAEAEGAAAQAAEVGVQLAARQAELEEAGCRAREVEAELSDIRHLAILLAKTAQLQGAQALPPSDHAVWAATGALGGVQHTLDVVMSHLKAQESKVRAGASQAELLQDRLTAESNERAALAQDLRDAQLLYAKAVADREGFESRAAAAEAEKKLAAADLDRAKQQAAGDAARLRELQDSVLALTAQVAALQPLAPRVDTLEAEKASLEGALERTDEALQTARRQLELSQTREADGRSQVQGFKEELSATLEANAQLLGQCEALTKRVQELEVSSREGDLAAEQLQAAKRRLETVKSTMTAMAEGHRRAVRDLESEVAYAASSRPTSAASSRGGPRSGSRPGSSGPRQGGGGGGGGWGSRPGTAAGGVSPRSGLGPSGGGGGGCGEAWNPMVRARSGAALVHSKSRHSMAGLGPASPSARQLPQGGAAAPWQQPPPDSHPGQGLFGGGGSEAGPAGASSAAAGDRLEAPDAARAERLELPNNDAQSGADEGASDDEGRSASSSDGEAEISPPLRLPREVQRALDAQAAAVGPPRGRRAAQRRQAAALCAFAVRAKRLLVQQAERSALLEVQLLKAQEGEVQRLMKQEQDAADKAAAEGREQLDALSGAARALRSARGALSGAGCWEAAAAAAAASGGGRSVGGGEVSVLSATAQVLAALRSVADERAEQRRLVLARRDKSIQSDDPLQAEWLKFIRALLQPATPARGGPGGPAAPQDAGSGASAPASAPAPKHALQLRACVEAVVRVYHRALREYEDDIIRSEERQQRQQQQQPQQQQQQQQQQGLGAAGLGAAPQGSLFDVLVAHYAQDGTMGPVHDHDAWRDPEGPIARLLLSCRHHAPSCPKLECFLRFASASASGEAWGPGQWSFMLAVLLGVKRLVAGLWKGLLREWASVAGAQLPVQAVHDLLANLYNCQDPGALPKRVTSSLEAIMTPGQFGASVDLDGLLSLLIQEHVAGRLPLDPLLQPRRLTDGTLSNSLNAWGVAAASPSYVGAAALQLPPPASPPALTPAASGGAAALGWAPASPNGSGRLGTSGGRSGNGGSGSSRAAQPSGFPASSGGGLLPRIKTPDAAASNTGGPISGPPSSRGGGSGPAAGAAVRVAGPGPASGRRLPSAGGGAGGTSRASRAGAGLLQAEPSGRSDVGGAGMQRSVKSVAFRDPFL